MFETVEELSERLSETGTFPGSENAKAVVAGGARRQRHDATCACSCAGGGHPRRRLQCYSGVTSDQAIGQFEHSLQRLYMEYSKTQSGSWQELQASLEGRDFFRAGPLMRALDSKRPCVLLIDELDQVDESFEALLLEILSAWALSIPEFGTVRVRSIPFVVLTSNEERRLGDPIRRRSLYLRVDHSTPEREAEIIASRTPGASHAFHNRIAGIARAFRNYSLEKPPSV
jgi:MoxR-like ATPase